MRDWASGDTAAQFNPAIGGWLVFALFGLTYSVSHVDPILIAKVAAPIIYGALGFSEYLFSRRVIGWSQSKSALVVFIASVYFVSLRVSWDLFRNTLGLAFMLLTLAAGKRLDSRRTVLGFSTLILLVVFTHLLVATLLIPLVLFQILFTRTLAWRAVLAVIPGVVYYGTSVVEFQTQGITILASGTADAQSVYVFGYLFYIFLPLIPIALVGSRTVRSDVLKLWLLVCGLAILLMATPLSPSTQLVLPDRWALMMFLPLAILSVEGLSVLRNAAESEGRWNPTIAMGWVLVIVILGSSYAGLQANNALPYYRYFTPTSMLQSTVPLEESHNVIAAFEWLSTNVESGSALMTTDAMYGWAREYFNGDATIVRYYSGVTLLQGLQATIEAGYSRVYTVWWSDGRGWYGEQSVPAQFVLVYQVGDFGVFLYLK